MITKTDLDRVLGEHFGHEGDSLTDLGTFLEFMLS